MQRYLSIVLNESCTVSKTLVAKENYDLDKHILKKFDNSEQVREYFKNEIEIFMQENANLIASIEQNTGKKYRGQIVILQVREDSSLKRIKVLYKEDIKNIKNSYLSDQAFMRQFIYHYKKYFSEYIINKTRYFLSESVYKRLIAEWHKQIETSENVYEVYRAILKFSETKKEILKQEQQKQVLETINNQPKINFGEDEDTHDPDWDFHPDLDDIARGKYVEDESVIQYVEDDYDTEEKSKQKTKTKHIELPNQLSFFD